MNNSNQVNVSDIEATLFNTDGGEEKLSSICEGSPTLLVFLRQFG